MIIVFLLGFSFFLQYRRTIKLMMAQRQDRKIIQKKRSSTATKKVLDKLNVKDPMDAVFDTLNYK